MKISNPTLLAAHAMAILTFFTICKDAQAGTSGKIAGRVIEKSSGEPLPGANVVMAGTNMGAAADADGYYFILNVPPGVYSVKASMIGYRTVLQSQVRVQIDLTSTVDFTGEFALTAEAVQFAEVAVVADRPVVQPDISTNVANINTEEAENLPVGSVTEIVELQAGVEPGLVIRGGDIDQLGFLVDGVAMVDARNNNAFTSVSLTAIDELQVQTGGFNAEYGNLRSGLINIVTKDAPRDRFHFEALMRYKPPQALSFGPSAKDPNAYWMRPYLAPEVALAGTQFGSWDQYTQRQYPIFEGWNQYVQSLASDNNPRNDLTVAQAQEAFDYFHRKEVEIQDPGYEIDFTAAGPLMPGLGKALGNLRMQASYRGVQEPYIYPQVRKTFREDLVQGKLISDLASGRMKLVVQGWYDQQRGTAPYFAIDNLNNSTSPERGGIPTYPWSYLASVTDPLSREKIFATNVYSIADMTRWLLGAEFTHTLNKNTFYQFWLNRAETEYDNHPGRARNPEIIKVIGQVELDETPFGWSEKLESSLNPFYLGSNLSIARDTSKVVTWTGRVDLTSQLDRWHLLKAGVEIIAYDYNIHSADVLKPLSANFRQVWSAQPKQFSAYMQDKIEFNAMIANVGLRLDYFDPSGNWIVYEPFDRAFSARNRDSRDELLTKTATEKQLVLSPRLGVSFPLSLNSKLFFNYGHFRQMMTARELFQVEEEIRGNVVRIGNPNLSLQKTVAYELGYEQNLFKQLLLRLSGYYRDTDNQPVQVWFVSLDNAVRYSVNQALNYSDVRGFEITVNKNRGKWLRGFANFTFMQFKTGNFGFSQQYESVTVQREYERTATDHYQFKPVAQPYATMNLELFTTPGYGPRLLGGRPLADWRLDLLGGWRAGKVFTWSGPGGASIAGLRNNVRMQDFWSLDLRLSKNFKASFGQMQLFVDVNNVLNLKQIYVQPEDPYAGPFEGQGDWDDYMKSLHLPAATFEGIDEEAVPYFFIPGNDRVGDYRKEGVHFVPIEIVATAGNLPAEPPYLEPGRVVLYYVHDAGTYMQFREGEFVPADPRLVEQVLKNKAYIDMPNETYRTFLDPRSAIFGMRFSF